MKGFTLIELIITLMLISIVAGLGYTSYQSHVVKARRDDGKSALLMLANQMEVQRHNQTPPSYAHATIAAFGPGDIALTDLSDKGFYRLQIHEATSDAFTLRATAVASQADQDPMCHILEINHLGLMRSMDTQGSETSGCW